MRTNEERENDVCSLRSCCFDFCTSERPCWEEEEVVVYALFLQQSCLPSASYPGGAFSTVFLCTLCTFQLASPLVLQTELMDELSDLLTSLDRAPLSLSTLYFEIVQNCWRTERKGNWKSFRTSLPEMSSSNSNSSSSSNNNSNECRKKTYTSTCS